MNANGDLGRRLSDHYASDAPSRAPDWLLESAIDTIDITPQRRVLIRVPWRNPLMNTYAKLGAAAVAAVVLVVGGFALLRPGASSDVGGTPSALPSAAPSALPSAAPSVAPSIAPPSPLLPATARLDSFGQIDPLPAFITATVPTGWTADGAILGRAGLDLEPAIYVVQIDNRFKDPCADHTLLSPAPGPSVSDLLVALASQPGIQAGPITDVTIDGYRGKSVELTTQTDPATCGPGSEFGGSAFWTMAAPDGFQWGPERGQTDRIYALDIDGARFTFIARFTPGILAEDRAALEAIIDSIEIEPGSAASPSP
jgi:hypothetical protein